MKAALLMIVLLNDIRARLTGSDLKSLSTTDGSEVSKEWRELCDNPDSPDLESFLERWLLQDNPEQANGPQQDEAEESPWTGGWHGLITEPVRPATDQGTLYESYVSPVENRYKRPLVSFDHLGPSESTSSEGFESDALSGAGVYDYLHPLPGMWATHDLQTSKASLAPRSPSPNSKQWSLQDGMEEHSGFHDPGTQMVASTNPRQAAPGRSSQMMSLAQGHDASEGFGLHQVNSEPLLVFNQAIGQGSVVDAHSTSRVSTQMDRFGHKESPAMTQNLGVDWRELDQWLQASKGPRTPETSGQIQSELPTQFDPVAEPTDDFAGHPTDWSSSYAAKRQRTSLGSFSENLHYPLEVLQTGGSSVEKDLDRKGVSVEALDLLETRRLKKSTVNAGLTPSAKSQAPIKEPHLPHWSPPTMGFQSNEQQPTGKIGSTWHDGNAASVNWDSQTFDPKKARVSESVPDVQVPLITSQDLLSQYLDSFGPDLASLISTRESSIDPTRERTSSLDNSSTDQESRFILEKDQNMIDKTRASPRYDYIPQKSLKIKGNRSPSSAKIKEDSQDGNLHSLKPWEIFQPEISKGGIENYLKNRGCSIDKHPKEKDVSGFIDSLVSKKLNSAYQFVSPSKILQIRTKPLISWLLKEYPSKIQPDWLSSKFPSPQTDYEHLKWMSEIIYQNSSRAMINLGFQKKLEEFLQELSSSVEANSTKPAMEERVKQSQRVSSVVHRVVLGLLYYLHLAHQLDSVNLSGENTNAKKKLNGVFEMLREFWLKFPFGSVKSEVPKTNTFYQAVDLDTLIVLNSAETKHGTHRTVKNISTFLLKKLFSGGEKQFINVENCDVPIRTLEKLIKDVAIVDWLANFNTSEK